jgi:ubiquinol-cytochrome c reductase cytochrome b subunit
MRLRARLSQFWVGKNIQKPTREELEEARHHAEHELAVHDDGHQHLSGGDYEGDYELDGQPADDHQLDGRNSTQRRPVTPRGDRLRRSAPPSACLIRPGSK